MYHHYKAQLNSAGFHYHPISFRSWDFMYFFRLSSRATVVLIEDSLSFFFCFSFFLLFLHVLAWTWWPKFKTFLFSRVVFSIDPALSSARPVRRIQARVRFRIFPSIAIFFSGILWDVFLNMLIVFNQIKKSS